MNIKKYFIQNKTDRQNTTGKQNTAIIMSFLFGPDKQSGKFG